MLSYIALFGVAFVLPIYMAVAQDVKCSPLHLIYARATMEAKGYGAAGGSLITELQKLIPDVTTYPVDYPADWSGCATETKGVNDILKHIDATSKACPEQKFVLGGHSQGSVVVTSSISKIPQAAKAKLLAVTMFGAPPCLAEVKDRCKSYCNAGDDICAGTSNPKSDGLCRGPKGARLWTGAPLETKEILDLAAVIHYQHGEFDAKAAEECNADVPEKGHAVSGFAKSYNRDAFYTKAAACYIYKKLKDGAA
ncbi:hypothetical protein E2P81_ATG03374 [Venturia nashicola]|uniref:cutinase n=1 Tax=Venturia nashicola TaxID=86259 RepID=A0A4Z1PKF8_9PEZI|nr:hypothetical protein E6O75_ATG03446 [Venturia nashicola]TLD36485.1 hypothetical protein E2P81_ATG03374 [Venturia nashicola]